VAWRDARSTSIVREEKGKGRLSLTQEGKERKGSCWQVVVHASKKKRKETSRFFFPSYGGAIMKSTISARKKKEPLMATGGRKGGRRLFSIRVALYLPVADI